MKKILALLAFIPGLAFAQISANDLMGLGMPGPLAAYFVANGIALSTLSNNSALKSANATPGGTALNLIKGDASNNTVIDAITGKVVQVRIATTPLVDFQAGAIVGKSGNLLFSNNGTGGQTVSFASGPAANATSGGFIQFESSGTAVSGNGSIRSANKAGGVMIVDAAPTNGTLELQASSADQMTLTAALNSSLNSLSFPTPSDGVIHAAGVVITPATNTTPTAGSRILNQRFGLIATAAPTAVFVFAQPTASVGRKVEVYNQGASPLQILPEDGAINVAAALTPFACATQKFCECTGVASGQMLCQAK